MVIFTYGVDGQWAGRPLGKKKRLQNQAEDDKRNIFRKKATETKKDPPQKKGTDFKRPPK